MKRVGPIENIEQWRGELRGYNVYAKLLLDGKIVPYEISFDDGGLFNYWPRKYKCKAAEGTGYDTLKDPATRRLCIGAVQKLNRYLRWRFYDPAAIQKDGTGYRVSYLTVSPQERSRPGIILLDPYVNFMISRAGIVFGISHGG